jgi:hypothetical protein
MNYPMCHAALPKGGFPVFIQVKKRNSFNTFSKFYTPLLAMIGIDFQFKMGEIPVNFDYEGRQYKGVLSWTPGYGGYHWDLMVNNFYRGQLLYIGQYEWASIIRKMICGTIPIILAIFLLPGTSKYRFNI